MSSSVSLRSLSIAVVGLAWGGIDLRAEVAPAQARTVPVISFPTEAGRAYLLEGSTDGETWEAIGQPVFGDGSNVNGTLPPGTPVYSQWRVVPVDPESIGIAPVSLADRTIVLNDRGRLSEVVFLDGSRGVYKLDALHARTFQYTTRKMAADRTVADLTFRDGSVAEVALTFTAPAAGSYLFSLRNAAGVDVSRDAGVFSSHAGRIRLESDSPPAFPPSLTGKTIVVQNGAEAVTLQFTEDAKVTVTTRAGGTVTVPFSFDLKSDRRAVLDLGGQGGSSTRYNLKMENSVGGAGTGQIMVPSPDGGRPVPAQVAPDVGGFNIPFDPVTIPPGNPPGNGHPPPQTIGGKTYLISGSDPFILVFNHDGTGSILRERDGTVEQTPFLYDYDPTGENGAKVTITFPGASTDKVEEYDVNFDGDDSGSFTQSRYENGERKSSEGGNFGPVATSGAGGGIVRP